jgi:cobalt-zinc-cadmium efflux system outer membrane protein
MRKILLTLAATALLPSAAMALDNTPEYTSNGLNSPSGQASLPRTKNLTLNTALEKAYAANPELAAAQNALLALDGTVLQAETRPNPELQATVEDTRSATRTSTLQLNQRIELGGKRSARIDAAERGRDLAKAEFEIVQASIQTEVTSAFYDTLVAQERVRLAQSSIALAESALRTAQKRVEAGKVSPVEASKAGIALAGARVDYARAESTLKSSKKRLATAMGEPQVNFETVEGNLETPPELPTIETLEARLTQSPTYRKAQIEVDRRKAISEVERSKGVPDVTVSLGGRKNQELGLNQAVFGVSIPIPVFDRNQGNLLESLRRADQAKDELTATQYRLSRELQAAYENLSASREEFLALREKILPSAQNAYEAASKGFEMGKFSFLEVLDAQRTLFDAMAQSQQSLAQSHRYAAELQGILGQTPANTQ